MSTHKKIDAVCIAVVFIMIALTALFMNGRAIGISPVVNADDGNDRFTANDLNGDWDISNATQIVLSDNGSTVSGNGAYVYDGDVCIVYAGCYVLSGALTNGRLLIDADKADKIWILLDGVSLHCEDDAAIRIEQADKVFLTLAEGSQNTISSGVLYDEANVASGVDGAIYSRDDLTINGTGSLVVDGAYQHGIVCNDDLVLAGGEIVVNAAEDGIHANDSVRIREAEITVSAGDDGITVSNDEETAYLYMESGSVTVLSCYEGFEAIDITIAGGSIDITSTDDGMNANGNGNGCIRIVDGDITITNPTGRDADGLDSNGSIYIEGGNVFISVSDNGGNSALDYGSEYGGECVISGGTVIACGNSRMAEGFDAASPQGFLMYQTTADAGTTISLKDADGRELLAGEIPCSFSSVVLSVPKLQVGDVCTIRVGDVEEQITIDNVSTSAFGPAGMFGGGMRNHQGDGGRGGNREEPGDRSFAGRKDGDFFAEKPQNFPADVPQEPPADASQEPPSEMPQDIPPRLSQDMPWEASSDGDRPDRQGMQEDGEAWALVGISILALFGGLIFAIKFKR